jgi:membrane protease YdiL (CAAX protease family)
MLTAGVGRSILFRNRWLTICGVQHGFEKMTDDILASAPKRLWGPWPTAGFGLVVIVVFIVTQALVAVVFIVAKLLSGAASSLGQITEELISDGNFIFAATVSSALVGFGLIMIIIKLRRGATMAEYLGLKPITKKTVPALLSITVGFVILSYAVGIILNRPIDSDFMTDAYRGVAFSPLLWVAVVVFAPVFEETLVRGFLFVGFRESRIGLAGTIVLTALIWAALHIQYGFYEIGVIFFLGIILGIVRQKTGSLWSSMIIHAFNNFLAMLVIHLYVNGVIT